MAVLLAILVLTFVASIIRPDFFAFTVLFVLEPPAFVSRTISVIVDSVAVGLIVLPVSIIDVSVSMNKAASTVCFIVFPVTFVKGAIDPDLNTATVFSALLVPLSFVLGSVI